ncbi:mechanosensitive ion channel family protein [Desulfogranum mediterraneum]|uniref:mechanosensitive ion channel family protein n=1 Tax=Desulfogranum mediterraneum TaxID=160661 RepID=UPI00041BAE84|nr:mechanosensitive ion channel family protein [Desulfogranum mediterraneum]
MRYRRTLFLLPLLLASLLLVDSLQARNLHDTFILARRSSPEAVWHSFIQVCDTYGKIVKSQGYTKENQKVLAGLSRQLRMLFDMRQTPPSMQDTESLEASIYMREALARFRPLRPGELPKREEAFKDMKDGYYPSWSPDDSAIAVVYVDSGPEAGYFQFSQRTLDSAARMYEDTRHLSYVDASVKGLHDAYFLTPGPLVPLSWVRTLPIWMESQYLNQTIWQWCALFVLPLLAGLLLWLFFRLMSWLSGNWNPVLKHMLRLLEPLLTIVMAMAVVEFLEDQIFVTGIVLRVLQFLQWAVSLVSAIAVVFIVGNFLTETILWSNRDRLQTIDTHLLRFGVRIGVILVATIVMIEGLYILGIPFATVLTGAGVTGLAIALAARESLSNIFGSMMLLLDKPFKVGQRVRVRGHNGTVEEIGIRSTKIRLLNGHLTAIPNEDVAKADIENIGERPHIRRRANITITYDTPPEKIDQAIAIIRDVLAVKEDDPESSYCNRVINADPKNPPRVFFNEFNTDSLNLMMVYYYSPPDFWSYQEHRHYINREIIRRFNEAGIEFAFPTQTLYLAGDKNRPLDLNLYDRLAQAGVEVFYPDAESDSSQGRVSDKPRLPKEMEALTPLDRAPVED